MTFGLTIHSIRHFGTDSRHACQIMQGSLVLEGCVLVFSDFDNQTLAFVYPTSNFPSTYVLRRDDSTLELRLCPDQMQSTLAFNRALASSKSTHCYETLPILLWPTIDCISNWNYKAYAVCIDTLRS
jgi:hypothetical protein